MEATHRNSKSLNATRASGHIPLGQRLHIEASGAVQGVGFRPFVYRLATDLQLGGWVKNTKRGATIEIEGSVKQLQGFLTRLNADLPAPAFIQDLQVFAQTYRGETRFEISLSEETSPAELAHSPSHNSAVILPDLATCSTCLQELFDPANRRYHYPLINCTHCGPRFSIIQRLPYDRPNTTMAGFPLCPDCQAEYDNPLDRRFHAQPNACPTCGPQLQWWDAQGEEPHSGLTEPPLAQALQAIRIGQIVAIKGLGGFQLFVDARNADAVARLRQRKHRPAKPFAVMYSTLEAIAADCELSEPEAALLRSPQSPIVLLKQKKLNGEIAAAVAPGNPNLGVMLPYTPLHHLLMQQLGFPMVATSANRSHEPLCIDNSDARQRLQGIADGFLIHNRPIQRPVDDSVTRIIQGKPQILRRARGYAPLPMVVAEHQAGPSVLAVGAQQKNTIALSVDHQILLSQHLGDLATVASLGQFEAAIADVQNLYQRTPEAIACDAHPDYPSTQFATQLAERLQVPLIPVQHHYAHSLACMAEHRLATQQLRGPGPGPGPEPGPEPGPKPGPEPRAAPLLSLAWDGTGYGTDGTLWGGELLQITAQGFERRGHLLPFRLPGGEAAIREPRRTALGLLHGAFGDAAFEMADLPVIQSFSPSELQVLKVMLSKPLNAPLTSSGGRLFDGVAALLGLQEHVSFEGQAAMALEFAVAESGPDNGYGLPSVPGRAISNSSMVWDWRPMIKAIVMDRRQGKPIDQLAAQFHRAVVEAMVGAIATQISQDIAQAHASPGQVSNPPKVLLTGGCFQNRYLTDTVIARLRSLAIEPYWHQQLPPNDGGIAVGQVLAAWRVLDH